MPPYGLSETFDRLRVAPPPGYATRSRCVGRNFAFEMRSSIGERQGRRRARSGCRRSPHPARAKPGVVRRMMSTDRPAFVETVSDLSEFLARCPSCESVLLRMVRTFDASWLDMSGMSALRILMMINSTSESYSP
jgi:hypothetical protein